MPSINSGAHFIAHAASLRALPSEAIADLANSAAEGLRAPTAEVYQGLAPIYDARYDDVEYDRENAYVFQVLRSIFEMVRLRSEKTGQPLGRQARVLDVGAGTGLALDLGLVGLTESSLLDDASTYLALDPASAMLLRLREKHPSAPVFVGTLLDLYRSEPRRRFDLAFAMFGVGSYLAPGDLRALRRMLTPTGAALVMTYAEDYRPTYYAADPPTKRRAERALRRLRGRGKAVCFGTLSGKHNLWVVFR